MQRVGTRARGTLREIVVPASIANLGPGLDTLGLAVTLYLRVRVTEIVHDGRGRLRCRFLDGPLRGPNRIERAFKALRPQRGLSPSVHVDVRSEIPVRSGLGSSAAATVAGLRLRELVDGRRPGDEILAAASKIEGASGQRGAGALWRRDQLLRDRDRLRYRDEVALAGAVADRRRDAAARACDGRVAARVAREAVAS